MFKNLAMESHLKCFPWVQPNIIGGQTNIPSAPKVQILGGPKEVSGGTGFQKESFWT